MSHSEGTTLFQRVERSSGLCAQHFTVEQVVFVRCGCSPAGTSAKAEGVKTRPIRHALRCVGLVILHAQLELITTVTVLCFSPLHGTIHRLIIRKTVKPSAPIPTYFFWKYVDTFAILDMSTFFSISTPRDAFDFALRFLLSPSSSTAARDLAVGAPASATAISLAFTALMCVSSEVKLGERASRST